MKLISPIWWYIKIQKSAARLGKFWLNQKIRITKSGGNKYILLFKQILKYYIKRFSDAGGWMWGHLAWKLHSYYASQTKVQLVFLNNSYCVLRLLLKYHLGIRDLGIPVHKLKIKAVKNAFDSDYRECDSPNSVINSKQLTKLTLCSTEFLLETKFYVDSE